MSIKNISNTVKYKLLAMIGVLFFLWFVSSSIFLYVNCLILDENNIAVHKNWLLGNLVEAQLVEDSDFIYLPKTDELIDVSSVSDYVRISNESKSYYNYDENVLVLPLLNSEKRKIIIQFAFLDLVLLISFLVVSFIYNKWNFIKKLIFGGTLAIYLIISYVVWAESLNTLFQINRYVFFIGIGKLFIFLMIAFIRAVEEYIRVSKNKIKE